MSVNFFIEVDNIAICIGCLSKGRRLSPILKAEHKVYFNQLLNFTACLNEPLLLCWECAALIENGVRFKERVNMAAHLLHKLSDEQEKATLSKLSIKNLAAISLPEVEEQVLTFVKVENDDKADDDNDNGFFMSDAFVDDSASEKDHLNESYIKPTERQRTPSIDSDDIPLNQRATKKPKEKSKKKKEKHRNVDRRKHPAPKKEKPSGVVTNKRVNKKLQELNIDSSKIEMVVLSWEEVEEARQKALKSVSFTRHVYKCYDCVLGFNHKFKLENHMKKHDESAGALSCATCRVRFASAHALCAHRRRHRVRWRCAACAAVWSRAAVAADHYSRAHGGRAPTHACAQCGHVAATLGKLRIHLKDHMERQKCELCGKSFRDRTSLRTHLFIHKGEKEYACPQCDKKFLFKKAMEIHLVTHEAPAGLYCHECDVNFKNQMSYYQHMKYNLKHIDPSKLKYECSLCDKRFVKARRLEEHNVAVHLKTTPVQCTMAGCNFSCSSRPVLRTHVRMIHRGRRAVRNHVCHACGKAYTTKKALEGHMSTHTGERPFKCKLCTANFGYEAALYNHNRLVHLKARRPRAQQVPQPPAWGFNVEVQGEGAT